MQVLKKIILIASGYIAKLIINGKISHYNSGSWLAISKP